MRTIFITYGLCLIGLSFFMFFPIMVAGILVGRLEIMAVPVLFSSSFWCDV